MACHGWRPPGEKQSKSTEVNLRVHDVRLLVYKSLNNIYLRDVCLPVTKFPKMSPAPISAKIQETATFEVVRLLFVRSIPKVPGWTGKRILWSYSDHTFERGNHLLRFPSPELASQGGFT